MKYKDKNKYYIIDTIAVRTIMNFLQQTKLTKEEWDKIERPIQNEREKCILNMINNGYNNVDIKYDENLCLSEFLKIDKKYDYFTFDKLLKEHLDKVNKKNILEIDFFLKDEIKLKGVSKSDQIKIKNSIKLMKSGNKYDNIIEFVVIEQLKNMTKVMLKDKDYVKNKKYTLSLFNINILFKNYKNKINESFFKILEFIFEHHNKNINYNLIIKNISKYVEHNNIFNYKMNELYQHQKDIYNLFKSKRDKSKFVFYCAPTSSGKTLTPLALTNEYKVIFVCASKHIGLSLAKSAFFLEKKIGFAFGCNDIENIRLNYNAINSYKEVKKRKLPDHSDGTKVELMICDILSFESAMLYMKAFNNINDLVLFWDEPTIGLDEENPYLHEIIKKNWTINKIPNIVFSCATLPKREEINKIIENQLKKYNNSYFEYIESSDQYTNLCIYDVNGNVIMPHNYFKDHNKMIEFIDYQSTKYYKFYNCNECSKFLIFYDKNIEKGYINKNLFTITDINLNKIKDIYIQALKQINPLNWELIQNKYFEEYPILNKDIHNIGPEITTKNASSLTNGPTLYISDNVENVCKYLLHKSNIDKSILKNIEAKIEKNSELSEIILSKSKDYEDKIEKYKDNENVMTNMRLPQNILDLKGEIDRLQGKIQGLNIENKYKPNTRDHYNKWNTTDITFEESDVYTGYVNDIQLKNVLQLYTTHSIYKILLLLGIGVFSNNIIENNEYNNNKDDIVLENNKYIEHIKELAENKSLYLIIANSDYIYGTNYQFSHCYLGKDMKNMTQEKVIQCIGRIGRQEKNKHFSFRFRSNEQIELLYSIPEVNIEANNMNKLFI